MSEVAAKTVKRVALELGGKSANVILDDADLAKAVKAGVENCYLNSGQTCSAWTRMLVPKAKHDEAVDIAKKVAEKFTVGSAYDPRRASARSSRRRSTSASATYIKKGVAEGATLVTGGPEQPENLPKGFFVKPTVFANVKNKMTIAQEEIFGPVLCIIPYETRKTRSASRTTPSTASPVASGRPIQSAPSASRGASARARSTSTAAVQPVRAVRRLQAVGARPRYGKWGLEEFLEVKSMQGG